MVKKLFFKLGVTNKDEFRKLTLQFIKFGLVGVSNTAISYGIEMLCYYVLFVDNLWSNNVRIAATSAVAFFVSTLNSYYWNNRYVFKSGRNKRFTEHLRTYGKTVLCYGVTGLLIAPLLKMWLTDSMAVPFWLTSLSTLIITIPLNFLLNKFWAYGERKTRKEDK